MPDIRSRLIRLAYATPTLRADLIPLIVGMPRTDIGGRIASVTANRRRFRDLLKDPDTMKSVRRFLERLLWYQGNPSLKQNFRRDYELLPLEIREMFSPSTSGMKNLWRGDDGQSEEDAISWTKNRSLATTFGSFLFNSEKDLIGYDAAVDTARVAALIRGTELDEYDIGDDEGEIILIGPRWKRVLTYDELEHYRPRRRS